MKWLLAALALTADAPRTDQPVLIRGAHVFDGSGAAARAMDVLVQGGRIAAVAARIARPRDARVIDGRGQTLLPGLHDLHTHMRSTGFDGPEDAGKAYAAYLAAGVTTANDFSVYGEMFALIRRMTGSGQVPAPRLKLAVRFSTTGGHGAERGWGDDFTLEVDTPRAAHAAMRVALAYRPDVIKVFSDGWRYGRTASLSSMNAETLGAIVADAHAAGVPVITHTVTLEGAKIAARTKVDALGHGIGDVAVDDELIALMKANRTTYVPTLAVYAPRTRFSAAETARLRPPERAREAEEQAPPEPLNARRWQVMSANLRALARAGVAIGVGTDAGIGGVYHGSATIRELKLLGALGMTPARALAAATSVSADVMGPDGRGGRIAPGQPADLVLTGGRPDLRLGDLHDVRRVFLAGREVPLRPLRALLASSAMSPLPRRVMAGPIDDGTRVDGRTALGTLPVNSSDRGIDHSDLHHVRTGPPGARSLFMIAEMGPAPQPYARLTLPLTPGAVELADAAGWTGVAFRARGAGAYRMLVDGYGVREQDRFFARFAADEDTREIRLPFAAMRGVDPQVRFDPRALRALLFELTGPPRSRVWLEVGNLRFYK